MSTRSTYISSSISPFYAQSSPSPPPTLPVLMSPPPPATTAMPLTPRHRPKSRRQLSITVPPPPGEYLVIPSAKPTSRASPSPGLSSCVYPHSAIRYNTRAVVGASGRIRGEGCIHSPFAFRATLSTPSPRQWISLRPSVTASEVDIEKVPRSALPRFGRSWYRNRVPAVVWLLFTALVLVSAVYVFLSPGEF